MENRLTHAFTYDVQTFRETFESHFTWLNGFQRNVSRFGEKTALLDPASGRCWTYSELDAESNRLAHALRRDGVCRNAVLLFALPNSPEFVFCYLAAHKLGAIACPVNYRQSVDDLASVLEDSRPAAFLYTADTAAVSENALRAAAHKPPIAFVVGGAKDAYARYVAGQPETAPPPFPLPHIYDETTRLYTSGTTGRPKGVPVNNINEIFSAHDVMMHFPLGPADRTMNLTPWFHRGGLHAGGPCPTFYAGGDTVILRTFSPRRCLEYVQRYRVTFLVGVPSVIELLAREQERASVPADLSSLRGLVAMGAPLDKALCERYRRLLTPNLCNGYGTTETFWNTFLSPDDLPDKAGSVGRACTDDNVRVVALRRDGSRAEPEETVPRDNCTAGEIIISAPAKSSGSYCNAPEETSRKFYKGWLYTGDVGTWDQNAFVTVSGRADDMIISAGENIYPSRIETILNGCPKVAESAVIGVPDRLRGEALSAFVVPADSTLTIAELRTYCVREARLPACQRPREYHLVRALPHNATGKLQRRLLRDAVRQHPPGGLH